MPSCHALYQILFAWNSWDKQWPLPATLSWTEKYIWLVGGSKTRQKIISLNFCLLLHQPVFLPLVLGSHALLASCFGAYASCHILLRTSLFIYVLFNGHLFLVDIFWLIWATLPSPDVLNRRYPGLSIDIACVWVASLISKEEGNHKEVQWEDSVFFDPQEDLVRGSRLVAPSLLQGQQRETNNHWHSHSHLWEISSHQIT